MKDTLQIENELLRAENTKLKFYIANLEARLQETRERNSRLIEDYKVRKNS